MRLATQRMACSFLVFRKIVYVSCILFLLANVSVCQTRATSLSILDFGNPQFGLTAAEKLRDGFKLNPTITLLDAELSRAAAKGAGYSGSLNMTVSEARDLGSALSSDFYVIGDAQTLRRSSSSKPIFYESYCSIFLISSRSGKLALWERPMVESSTSHESQQLLMHQLSMHSLIERMEKALKQTASDERKQRSLVTDAAPVIEQAPDDEKVAEIQGLRLPRPFRRLRPEYPATAAKADAEATVDVLVDVGADGEVENIEIVRWAGFGLDEATVATVSQLHFFPAMRDGVAVPLRVLLRYNFRKPSP